jgi:hypothetical protein
MEQALVTARHVVSDRRSKRFLPIHTEAFGRPHADVVNGLLSGCGARPCVQGGPPLLARSRQATRR